ncbi:MAG: phosphoglycerate mutase family protein [Candidatus Shapirobacteria bacterium]|nr:phosphoglycerate mutase family protein [Candidatus Shapirobacteria bacterium]
MATIIYLTRHCSYQNPKNIIPFRLPGFPLDFQGRQKAYRIAEFFKKNSQVDKIYSSPILRTKQTAQIIAKSLNLRVLIDSLLIEVDSPFQGVNKSLDVFSQPKHIKGGGESIKQVSIRMMDFIKKVLKEYPNKEIIALSHGDPIMICVDILTEGKVKEPLLERKDYVRKGEIFKLVFDQNNKIKSFDRINLS